MMSRRQSRFGLLRTALMLVAVLALVLSRSLTATAGLALPPTAAHTALECHGHSVGHPAGHSPGHHAPHSAIHHHADAQSHGLHVHGHHGVAHSSQPVQLLAAVEAAAEPQFDLPEFPGNLPCCVSGAAFVMPVLEAVTLPVLSPASGVAPARVLLLDGHIPEGPSEPPRTSDQA